MRINRELALPLKEIELRASRSSGPGGQHANVTASRIEASFDVLTSPTLTDAQRRRLLARLGPRVAAVSQDARGQARNRELALARLRDRVAAALKVPRTRRATGPSRGQRADRLRAKRHRAQRKRDRRAPPADE